MSVSQTTRHDNRPVLLQLELDRKGLWQGFPVLQKIDALRRAALQQDVDMADLELAVRHVTRLVAKATVAEMVEALKDRDEGLPRPLCPVCLRPMCRNRKDSLTLQLLECQVSFLRWYCECRTCKRYVFPLDASLGLPRDGEVTPLFGQDLCFLAMQLPMEASVRVLQQLCGRSLSKTALLNHLERDGDALHALEVEEANALWPFDEQGKPRSISRRILPGIHAPPPPGGWLIVEMDGVFANLGREPSIRKEIVAYRELAKSLLQLGQSPPEARPTPFREVRQMRMYRLKDRVIKKTRNGGKRTQITQSETVSVVNNPDLFKRRVNAVTHVWEADHYKEVAILGDGGAFIWELAALLFPRRREVLDIQHTRSHIHGCGNALFGEGSKEARNWSRRWCAAVFESGPDSLLVELGQLSQQPRSETAARILANLIDYVTEHRHRMNYPEFRRLGLPIASGAIESANRQVVGDRCKRSGMGWCQSGLQRILSLRAAYISGNWDRIFKAIRERRRYTLPHPTKAAVASQPRGLVQTAGRRLDVDSRTSDLASPIPPRKIAALLRERLIERRADGSLDVVSGHP